MPPLLQITLLATVACVAQGVQLPAYLQPLPRTDPRVKRVLNTTTVGPDGRYCVGFTPYVTGYAPVDGPQPSAAVLGSLLDQIVSSGRVKCLFTYGAVEAYGLVPGLAKERNLTVVMNIWLEGRSDVNDRQITSGIALARQYPDTIVAVSCGSEMRLKWQSGVANAIVTDCIRRLRAANISQAVGHQATWSEWCNVGQPGLLLPECRRWEPVAGLVDVLFVTAYAFWENRIGGNATLRATSPCVNATEASLFHVDRLQRVSATYPDKAVVLSEFGWPGGPNEEPDLLAQPKCAGVGGSRPSESNKDLVARTTLCLCQKAHLPCILFSSNNEPWKGQVEGDVARYWGFCGDKPPYACGFPVPSGC